MGTKGHLQTQTVAEIQELLKERDTASTEHALYSPQPIETGPKPAPRALSQQKIDRKVVEQRIEEDRERHKRLRESIWAIPISSDQENEAEILWENTSDLGEDDYVLYSEEAEERMLCIKNLEDDLPKKMGKI